MGNGTVRALANEDARQWHLACREGASSSVCQIVPALIDYITTMGGTGWRPRLPGSRSDQRCKYQRNAEAGRLEIAVITLIKLPKAARQLGRQRRCARREKTRPAGRNRR